MLTEREQTRYRRQLAMGVLGPRGQEELKKSSLAVVGAGGLGSAVGLYCAAAGVGRLVVIDADRVELSNLNRQVLYGEEDLGQEKALRAQRRLAALNRDIEVEGVVTEVTADNAASLLQDVDVVVDCLDNFAGRYVLNQACLALNVPLVHGACTEMQGQVMTIIPHQTACLRCVFPRPPPSRPSPILGCVAGTVGTLQATEAIKLLAGIQPGLAGKLLVYDGHHLTWELIEVEKNDRCPQCGGTT
ncbi:MAG: HesA/MoeB/ThiF family protein [Thermoplasmatota archaeon]